VPKTKTKFGRPLYLTDIFQYCFRNCWIALPFWIKCSSSCILSANSYFCCCLFADLYIDELTVYCQISWFVCLLVWLLVQLWKNFHEFFYQKQSIRFHMWSLCVLVCRVNCRHMHSYTPGILKILLNIDQLWRSFVLYDCFLVFLCICFANNNIKWLLPYYFTVAYSVLYFWQMNDGPKETATSSEFDAFLATREKEVTSATSDSATASNHGGRTLQNVEEEQALFSL